METNEGKNGEKQEIYFWRINTRWMKIALNIALFLLIALAVVYSVYSFIYLLNNKQTFYHDIGEYLGNVSIIGALIAAVYKAYKSVLKYIEQSKKESIAMNNYDSKTIRQAKSRIESIIQGNSQGINTSQNYHCIKR